MFVIQRQAGTGQGTVPDNLYVSKTGLCPRAFKSRDFLEPVLSYAVIVCFLLNYSVV